MKNESSGRKGLVTFLIFSLLLNAGLAVMVILLYNKTARQHHDIAVLSGEITSKDAEVRAKITELEGLKSDLERISLEREKLDLSNDSLSSEIRNLSSTIYQLRKTARLDDRKRKELEKLIAGLKEQILQRDRQIAQLTFINDSLAAGMTLLGEEKQKLGDSLTYTANALALASVLKAENITVVGLKENGKEIEGEELKGNKLDRIRISFAIADNKAAKQEKKTFYVALTTPKGTVFSDPNNGGGLLKLADGTEVLYTLNESLNFRNRNEQISLTMLKGFNYQPGKYSIAVYCEGYPIGEGKFAIK